MVRVLGNSHERVVINDLGDVIYYRQKKDYTDQEFEKSKDLQREKNAGRILILDINSTRSSIPEVIGTEPVRPTSTLNLNEIKKVVSDAMLEQKQNVSDLVPMLVSALRQEMSGIVVQKTSQTEAVKTDEPTYVPEINMDNLKSSINIESKQSDENLSDALEALKNLGKST